MFAWPYGDVWPNVWAIVPCGAITLIWGWRRFIKWDHKRIQKDHDHHIEMMAHVTKHHEALMAKMDAHHAEHMKSLTKLHAKADKAAKA
jgi:hypothetical protein